MRISHPKGDVNNHPGSGSESHRMGTQISMDEHQNLPVYVSDSLWKCIVISPDAYQYHSGSASKSTGIHIRICWNTHQNTWNVHQNRRNVHHHHPICTSVSPSMCTRITLVVHQNRPRCTSDSSQDVHQSHPWLGIRIYWHAHQILQACTSESPHTQNRIP